MQLIILCESTSKCQSDYLYLSRILNGVYGIEHFKISPIFLNGIGNFDKKGKEVEKKIKSYSVYNNDGSYVIVCIDLDDDTPENNKRNEKIEAYCKKHHYYLVWFNRTIEEVVYKEKASNSEKKQKAEQFARESRIDEELLKRFKRTNQTSRCSSNFLAVIEEIDKK